VYEVWTVTVEIGGTDLESPVAATKHKSRPTAWSRQLPGSNPGSAWIGQGPGPGRRGKEAGVRASDATPPWRVLVLSCPGAAQAALASIQLHLPPTFQTDLARPAKSPNLISSLRNTSPPAPPAVPRRHSFRYCNNTRVQPPCRFRRHTNHCHRDISCLQRHIKRRRAKMPSLVLCLSLCRIHSVVCRRLDAYYRNSRRPARLQHSGIQSQRDPARDFSFPCSHSSLRSRGNSTRVAAALPLASLASARPQQGERHGGFDGTRLRKCCLFFFPHSRCCQGCVRVSSHLN
jgi:hypothetical protein